VSACMKLESTKFSRRFLNLTTWALIFKLSRAKKNKYYYVLEGKKEKWNQKSGQEDS